MKTAFVKKMASLCVHWRTWDISGLMHFHWWHWAIQARRVYFSESYLAALVRITWALRWWQILCMLIRLQWVCMHVHTFHIYTQTHASLKMLICKMIGHKVWHVPEWWWRGWIKSLKSAIFNYKRDGVLYFEWSWLNRKNKVQQFLRVFISMFWM